MVIELILDAIRKRRSIREFLEKKIPDEKIMELIIAAEFAPSARHNHAIEYVVVKEQLLKDKLYEITEQQFVKEAPILIVPVTDTTKTNWPASDLSVATENIFLQAAHEGLGAVWNNIRPENVGKVREILGIPKNFTLINLIPIGIPKKNEAPHEDPELSKKKIHHDGW
jgi:nitroreductase